MSTAFEAAAVEAKVWEPVLRTLNYSLFRFVLELAEPALLPVHYGSTLRGGLGTAFKQLVCVQPQIPECRACALLYQCAYPAIFETPVPRHLDDAPHLQEVSPYVLRPLTPVRPGEPVSRLAFHLLIFGKAVTYLPYFVISYNRLGERMGLGSRRTRFRLRSVIDETPGGVAQILYDGDEGTVQLTPRTISLWQALPSLPECVEKLTLMLTSPTRLKSDGKVTSLPDFGDVVAAMLRRLEQLSLVHGVGVWPVNNEDWLAAAAQVETAGANMGVEKWQRFSGRQKQSIRMGGVVGELKVKGQLHAFLPLLLAGEIVHMGRGTAFGNGHIQIRIEG